MCSAGSELPDGVWEDVLAGLREIEEEIGTVLGDPSNPLLLSVRSGAEVGPLVGKVVARRGMRRRFKLRSTEDCCISQF